MNKKRFSLVKKLMVIALSVSIFREPSHVQVNQGSLAQSPLLSIEGVLNEEDETLSDGSLYDIHNFDGKAGQIVNIQLESDEFDTYLILLDEHGEKIGENDDYSGDLNSSLFIKLPRSATYQIITNTYKNSEQGQYRLSVSIATEADILTQEAEALLSEALSLFQEGKYSQALRGLQQSLALYEETENLAEQGSILNNIGSIYYELDNYAQAISYYRRSLIITQEIGSQETETSILNNLGTVYHAIGNYPQAISYYQQSLVISKEIGDQEVEGRALNNLGSLYKILGDYSQALNYYQQSLVISQEIGDRNGEGATLGNIGGVYNNLGNYYQALNFYQQSLAISQEIRDRNGEAAALNNIGTIYKGFSNYSQALNYYQQSLLISQEIGDRNGEGITLGNIGGVYNNLSNYYQALNFYQRSLSISQEIGVRNSEAATLNDIATVYDDLSNYSQALSYYQQSLAISQETGNQDGEGIVLSNIGGVYRSLGDYTQALDYYQQSFSIHQKTGNRASEISALIGIGGVYEHLGNYTQALNFYQRSLVTNQEIGNQDGEGAILSNMGGVYRSLGDYTQALDYYQQSFSIHQKTGNRAGEASALDGIGGVYNLIGDYSQALNFYQKSLSIIQEIHRLRDEGSVLNNIGEVYYNIGAYSQALNYYQKSLYISQKIDHRSGQSITLSNIGTVYRAINDYSQALEYYQKSLVIAQEIGERLSEGKTVNNIGEVYRKIDNSRALDNYKKAIAIAQEIGDQTFEAVVLNNIGDYYNNIKDYSQSLTYYKKSLTIFNLIGHLPGQGKVLTNTGFVLFEEGNFLESENSLFQALSIWESLRKSDLATNDIISLFETQQITYRFLQNTLITQDKIISALEVSERSRARILLQQLSQALTSKLEQELTIEAPKVQDMQRIAQAQNSFLIEYSITSDNQLYIWVIQPNGTVIFRSVDITNHNLPQMVNSTRIALDVRNRSTPGQASTIEPREPPTTRTLNGPLQTLHQLLIDPVADLLPDNSDINIIFIPHGELFLVPFPALMDENGTYLIEKHTILTAPSIQILDLTRTQRDRIRTTEQPNSTALVVGNPTMPAVYFPGLNRYDTFSPLPGTEQEASAIAQILGTQPILGDAATEAELKQQMASANFIHLATHGLLEYGDPKTFGNRDMPGAIVLAPGNGDDGLLTSAEILDLDLNANMVILSACDTGLGNITGDGVIGLSRSFIAAGVPSLIVSLWAVPDAPTAELMTTFYQNLQEGQTKAQALRQAMLTTMTTHPDPINWAAFTLIGEAE